jgi:hypothetical protein
MTMIVEIISGHQAKLETPVMVFTNTNCSYPNQVYWMMFLKVCY